MCFIYVFLTTRNYAIVVLYVLRPHKTLQTYNVLFIIINYWFNDTNVSFLLWCTRNILVSDASTRVYFNHKKLSLLFSSMLTFGAIMYTLKDVATLSCCNFDIQELILIILTKHY